ncbi:SLAM family member 7 [Acomys russatus]|uniref:SLAM family member 7 n=1 Tax=Acomys russatus TaxID=60746 RepID=UPI0021E260E1|nr:SLAM family member 7 [Acomys russatus]
MAGFSVRIILTSFLCQLTATAASGTRKEVVGALDGSVTFSLDITKKEKDTVIWTFNTLTIAIKNKDNVILTQKHNKERIVFPEGSYSMTLSQLKKSDSGIYRVEIHNTILGSPFTKEYALHVYEYLSRPRITMDWQDNKNGTCRVNLTCSMEQEGENVTYSWKAVGQAANETHYGASLPISWTTGEEDKTLICTARNPISNSSTFILALNLCKGDCLLFPGASDAAKDLNSSVVFLCTILVPILLSIFLVVMFIVIQTKKRKGVGRQTGFDFLNLVSGCAVDLDRVESHQELPNLKENNEYDTIPYTNKTNPEDAENTLYSTVQIPKVVKSPSSLPAIPQVPRPLSFENVI